MTRLPLVSDLILELEDGTRVPLDPSFQVPVGLALGGDENGDRAPDSLVVVRSGDEIGAAYRPTP